MIMIKNTIVSVKETYTESLLGGSKNFDAIASASIFEYR
jgi:hypothetical protein